jgi:hypothetical protein
MLIDRVGEGKGDHSDSSFRFHFFRIQQNEKRLVTLPLFGLTYDITNDMADFYKIYGKCLIGKNTKRIEFLNMTDDIVTISFRGLLVLTLPIPKGRSLMCLCNEQSVSRIQGGVNLCIKGHRFRLKYNLTHLNNDSIGIEFFLIEPVKSSHLTRTISHHVVTVDDVQVDLQKYTVLNETPSHQTSRFPVARIHRLGLCKRLCNNDFSE